MHSPRYAGGCSSIGRVGRASAGRARHLWFDIANSLEFLVRGNMTCPLADVTILYPAAQTHAEFAPVVAAVKQLLAAKSKN